MNGMEDLPLVTYEMLRRGYTEQEIRKVLGENFLRAFAKAEHNAAKTLSKTVAEIPREIVDEILLVDDASGDETVKLARELDLTVFLHEKNFGYGRNQKTCYREALRRGADIVVMVHPDYQYSPHLIVPMAGMIAYGEYDAVLGSRILGKGALEGGMPVYKYVANRF
jgi:glycosyltransferase involved in cell wall biosynthesis